MFFPVCDFVTRSVLFSHDFPHKRCVRNCFYNPIRKKSKKKSTVLQYLVNNAHEMGHWTIAVDHTFQLYALANKYGEKQYVVEVCCGVNRVKAQGETVAMVRNWSNKLLQELSEEYDRIMDDWDRANDDYDNATEHGALQGVRFDMPQALTPITE